MRKVLVTIVVFLGIAGGAAVLGFTHVFDAGAEFAQNVFVLALATAILFAIVGIAMRREHVRL
jgi:hypothetical protein